MPSTELTPEVSVLARPHGEGMPPREGYAEACAVFPGVRTRVAEGVRLTALRERFSSERDMCLLGKGVRSCVNV